MDLDSDPGPGGANYATAHIEDVQTTFITKKLCKAVGEALVKKQKFDANYICTKRFEIRRSDSHWQGVSIEDAGQAPCFNACLTILATEILSIPCVLQ